MNHATQTAHDFSEIDRMMAAGDTRHGLDRLEKLAREGGVEAHYRLGCELKELRHPECVLWLQSAAEMGSSDAAHMLGIIYLLGDPIGMHPRKAVKWFTRAAESGHAAAQFKLAAMYDRGLGCAVNKAAALKWYSKAADQGDAEARFFAGQIRASHGPHGMARPSAVRRLKALLKSGLMRRPAAPGASP